MLIAPSAILPAAITPVGIELFVLANTPICTLVIASLDKFPESHVTLTVVFVEKDVLDTVPYIVPGVDATTLTLRPA